MEPQYWTFLCRNMLTVLLQKLLIDQYNVIMAPLLLKIECWDKVSSLWLCGYYAARCKNVAFAQFYTKMMHQNDIKCITSMEEEVERHYHTKRM